MVERYDRRGNPILPNATGRHVDSDVGRVKIIRLIEFAEVGRNDVLIKYSPYGGGSLQTAPTSSENLIMDTWPCTRCDTGWVYRQYGDYICTKCRYG